MVKYKYLYPHSSVKVFIQGGFCCDVRLVLSIFMDIISEMAPGDTNCTTLFPSRVRFQVAGIPVISASTLIAWAPKSVDTRRALHCGDYLLRKWSLVPNKLFDKNKY